MKRNEMRALTVLLVFTATAVNADEPDFYRDIYPFLKENCIACHNKTTTKAGLNMETPAMMKKGGDSGPGIVPGKGATSLIVEASIHTPDLEMPPKNNKAGASKLTPEQIAQLKTWIDLGAKDSVQETRQVVWQPLAAGLDPIYSVALSQDGRFAACGRSNKIQVYDLATRRLATAPVDPNVSGAAHRALVQSLAFSPDGTRLASGSFREVKIWKRREPAPSVRAAHGALPFLVTALSPDGTTLTGIDSTGSLHQVDTATGKVRKKIPGVTRTAAQAMALTPDGTKVAVFAVGGGGSLSIWDLAAGRQLAATSPPSPPPAPAPAPLNVRTLIWTNDSQNLVTAGDDKVLRVWTLTTFTAPKTLPAAPAKLLHLLPGTAPDQILTAGEDQKIRVVSLTSSKIIREFPVPGALAIHLRADGKQLVTAGTDGAIRLWDFASGKEISAFRGSLAEQQKLAELNTTVAAQTLEQNFQTAEIARLEAQNKALDELLKKANETITAQQKLLPEKEKLVKPARDTTAAAEKTVAEAGADEAKRKAALEALQKVQMAQVSAESAFSAVKANIQDAQAEVQRITGSKTKNTAAIGTAKAAIATAKKLQTDAATASSSLQQSIAKGSGKALALSLSADGRHLAALFADGALRVWATASGTGVDQATLPPTGTGTLVARADGTFTAASAKGDIVATSPAPAWTLERVLTGFADQVNAVRFSPDGKRLATGGGEPSRSGDIVIFDVASGKAVQTWKERHADAVLGLDFSADGKQLASGAADKIARVTEVATGKVVRLFEGHTHYVMGVAFRADGRVLATAGADGTVVTWDMILGERKKKIEGWRKEVTSVQFLGATNQIVTSAGDNLVRIVTDDGTQIRAIANLPEFMQSAAFSPTINAIVAGGEDSVLRVWNGADGKELATFGVN
ncbi:MAG: WD40 repeat/WD40 repeat [Verrucomicrobia bacterium]|nr:MAG: WD40 repeat/WD40 repeat [Verrucomicrobiota bacterium]